MVCGEVTQDEYCEPVIKSHTRLFDLDTYKILQSFLASKIDRLTIQRLTQEQLQNFMHAN
jgi:hypothetical protein